MPHSSVWIPERRLLTSRIPTAVSGWLFDPGSLTQRVVAHCEGHFSVRVLLQAHQRPSLDEARALAMDPSGFAVVREVHLLCDQTPLVFARSVIPHSTIQGRNRRLAYLRNRPLGAYLFAQPSLRRSEMSITEQKPGSFLFEHATRGIEQPKASVWGRRSVFRVHERPLLVAEFFLPALFR